MNQFPRMYLFHLTDQQAEIALQGLAELPAKISLGVIQEIQRQAHEQNARAAALSSIPTPPTDEEKVNGEEKVDTESDQEAGSLA